MATASQLFSYNLPTITRVQGTGCINGATAATDCPVTGLGAGLLTIQVGASCLLVMASCLAVSVDLRRILHYHFLTREPRAATQGTNFGAILSDITVTIGGLTATCSLFAAHTELRCNLPAQAAGGFNLPVDVLVCLLPLIWPRRLLRA